MKNLNQVNSSDELKEYWWLNGFDRRLYDNYLSIKIYPGVSMGNIIDKITYGLQLDDITCEELEKIKQDIIMLEIFINKLKTFNKLKTY